MDILNFKNAIRLLCSGFLHDGNDIDMLPAILREIAGDWEKAIAAEMEE